MKTKTNFADNFPTGADEFPTKNEDMFPDEFPCEDEESKTFSPKTSSAAKTNFPEKTNSPAKRKTKTLPPKTDSPVTTNSPAKPNSPAKTKTKTFPLKTNFLAKTKTNRHFLRRHGAVAKGGVLLYEGRGVVSKGEERCCITKRQGLL